MKNRLSFKDQMRLGQMGKFVTWAFWFSPETGLLASVIAAFWGLLSGISRIFHALKKR